MQYFFPVNKHLVHFEQQTFLYLISQFIRAWRKIGHDFSSCTAGINKLADGSTKLGSANGN